MNKPKHKNKLVGRTLPLTHFCENFCIEDNCMKFLISPFMKTNLQTMFKICLIVIISSLYNCSSDEGSSPKIIKIDPNEKTDNKLPTLTIETQCQLETKDSTLFGDIMSIEFNSNRIYLLDVFTSKSLIEFSDKGKFIRRTDYGRGPNEMINPFAFFIDKNSNNILVWDQTLSMMFIFDSDLNYLSKQKYNVPIQSFAIVNKNEFLVQSQFYRDYVYKLYSADFEKIIGEYIPDNPKTTPSMLFRPISTDNNVLLIAPYDYHVYQLKEDSIHSEFFFDFGEYKLKGEEIENIYNALNLISTGQRVSSLNELAGSKKYILFHVYFNKKKIHYAYSRDTGKTIRLNDYFENGSLPFCDIRGIVEKDIFYALVKPSEMFKFHKETDIISTENNVQDIQNPFLITFRITAE